LKVAPVREGWLVALVVVLGLALRVVAISGKFTITYDEATSYLAATCHEGAYMETVAAHGSPVGTWVPAAAWQRFISVEASFCFQTIARDLARFDIHPPLYFWLLHSWALLVGVHLWTGASLNLVFFAVTAVALFALGRATVHDPLQAAFVTALWAVSPAVTVISWEGRQYDLMALLSVLLVRQMLRLGELPGPVSPWRLGALLLTVVSGLLTHYHFALLVAGAGILIAGAPPRAVRARAAPLTVLAAGSLIALAIHPGVFESLGRQQRTQAEPFELAGLGTRIEHLVEGVGGFGRYGLSPEASPTAVLVSRVLGEAFLALAAVGAWQMWRQGGQGPSLLVMLLWIVGTHAALYLTFMSPAHATGDKYLSAFWPLFAFVPLFAVRACGRYRTPLAVALFLLVTAGGALKARDSRADMRLRAYVVAELGSARAVMLDTVERGVLPGILLLAPPHLRTFAADQETLLTDPGAWEPHLVAGSVYIASLTRGNTLERRRAILTHATGRHGVSRIVEGPWPWSASFWLQPRPAG
jgi:uncharacterized membrane protein